MDNIFNKIKTWNWFAIIYTLLLCILVIYAIYLLLYYSFKDDIELENEKTAIKLSNNKIQNLLNGSGINNIPSLNIVTTNPEIIKANECGNGPAYIGKTGTDHDCTQICSNSSASVINVAENEMYIYENTTLQVGAYCIIGDRPQCNMNTSYAMMTINSVTCRPRYPELIGGPLGNTIVACNNRDIIDPQNILWDYKFNEKFNTFTTILSNVDETLEDGSYRFQCRFNGYDTRKNQYMAHPFNRFHPIRNYCASGITSAHPNVKTIINPETGTYECDCGDFNETRVKNIDPNDKTSLCSNVSFDIKDDVKNRKLMTVPYRCFNLFSPISDVGTYLPCPNDQLIRDGSHYSSVTIPFSTNTNALIEHPEYKSFQSEDFGVLVGTGEIKE
ncbi:PIF-2 [Drosophila innubila nudivirus]|uniref:PIF-2 n=1 Tax=Drosophila innubila nudivirus TaxID=2057187 RepID=A0A2H4UXD7_9VIRU|nr:PIF-2 [Drosophila innubila nudivirus]ATZ81582.1 PIF-2 [Drosophila innubila nudivirus]